MSRVRKQRSSPSSSRKAPIKKKASTHPPSQDGSQDRTAWQEYPIVGIGASAGGLEAFKQLFKHLAVNTGMGFVLVQHLDPVHESALVQLLAKVTAMPIREASHNLRVERNHVYIIPPNKNMTIRKGRLQLQPRGQATGAQRSIDHFLISLAEDQGECGIGVILSGTASDGTLGMEAIKEAGGITFAQDNSAKYDSMPKSAVAAGCVDLVLSPEHIAKELARVARHPYIARDFRKDVQKDVTASETLSAFELEVPARGRAGRQNREKTAYQAILSLLHRHSSVDFSLYKPSTIQRRITRRTVLNKLTDLDAYFQVLRSNTPELDLLYGDLLISVTGFFRNPEAFEVLKQRVFPSFLSDRREDPVRMWVVGCSTGQEAYSLAMAYMEFADHLPRAPKFQIFATDLNDELLGKARAGLYGKSLVADLSPERLRRFFNEEDGGYRIRKPLREAIIFAKQNLLEDPPFSRMDLVTCRNLLIYVDGNYQEKAMVSFHYALKPSGYLFLGASESIGSLTDLFEPVEKKFRIYRKKSAPSPALGVTRTQRNWTRTKDLPGKKPGKAPEEFHTEINVQREADRVVLNRFAPAGVLVNSQWQILQFRGDTSLYLKPPTGHASFNVMKMAREGLMLPLRTALNRAKKTNDVVRRESVRLDRNGHTRMVKLEVVPLKNLQERCYLIFFEEDKRGESAVRGTPSNPARFPVEQRRIERAQDRRVADLERDLVETRDYLQSVQDQNEAAMEELQASNEEVTSANEELQSVNEELETSKEELESSNEELTTINEEMANRNAELKRLTDDLVNLQTSTRLAIVLLGRDLIIRRFSAQAERLFNLHASDVGRPISHVRHNLDLIDLDAMLGGVIETVQERECEVRTTDGRWYSLRVRPYMTLDNKVDGAVLVLIDIDSLKRSEQAVIEAREQAEAIIRTVPDPLVVLSSTLEIHSANEAFYRTFKLSPAETDGRSLFDLGHGSWDIPRLHDLLEDILPRHSFFNDVEVTHTFERIGRRTLLFNARSLKDPSGKASRILMGVRDITEVLTFQAEMRRSELRYRRLFEAAHDGILILDPVTRTILDANPFVSDLLGYRREELLGKQLFEIGVFNDGAAVEAAFGQLDTEGHVAYSDMQVKPKSGNPRVLQFVSNLYREDGERVIQCTILDITERVRAQEFRNLAARLELVREEERALLAREIHDELGQTLTGLKMDLDWLVRQSPPAEPGVAEKLNAMSGIIEATMQSVRNIATQLRPVVLDHLGLIAAIEWLIEDYHARTGIQFTRNFVIRHVPMDRDRATAVFRIIQEALTNIVRHAHATHVKITAQESGGKLVIEVVDDGRGITPEENSDLHSIGLQGMRERATLIGGEATITGIAGQGTLVRVTVPLDDQK